MKTASCAFKKAATEPAAQVFQPLFASTVEPGKDRCKRLAGVVEEKKVVHEGADAYSLNRFCYGEFANYLPESFENRVNGKRCRAGIVQFQFPAFFGELRDFKFGTE